MAKELAAEAKAAALTTLKAMANRIAAANVGFDPAIILAILTWIIQNWCKKPATVAEAMQQMAAAFNHRKKCPLLFRPGFRMNKVQDIDDINDLWGDICDDADRHQHEVAAALAA